MVAMGTKTQLTVTEIIQFDPENFQKKRIEVLGRLVK